MNKNIFISASQFNVVAPCIFTLRMAEAGSSGWVKLPTVGCFFMLKVPPLVNVLVSVPLILLMFFCFSFVRVSSRPSSSAFLFKSASTACSSYSFSEAISAILTISIAFSVISSISSSSMPFCISSWAICFNCVLMLSSLSSIPVSSLFRISTSTILYPKNWISQV